MPPARASGEILKKGTAVVTMFIGADCAIADETKQQPNIKKQADASRFFCIFFILIIRFYTVLNTLALVLTKKRVKFIL